LSALKIAEAFFRNRRIEKLGQNSSESDHLSRWPEELLS